MKNYRLDSYHVLYVGFIGYNLVALLEISKVWRRWMEEAIIHKAKCCGGAKICLKSCRRKI
ncbi:MAG: hypothetical protein ACLTDP_01115 [Terrisporobacter sp.]